MSNATMRQLCTFFDEAECRMGVFVMVEFGDDMLLYAPDPAVFLAWRGLAGMQLVRCRQRLRRLGAGNRSCADERGGEQEQAHRGVANV